MRITPSSQYIISLPRLHDVKPQRLSLHDDDFHYRLLIVSEGGHALFRNKEMGASLSEATIYLIPPGEYCSIHAQGESIKVLEISFRAHANLCNGLCPNIGPTSKISGSKSRLDVASLRASKTRPRRSSPVTTRLPLSQGLRQWAKSIEYLLQYPEIPLGFFDNKLEEFFLLIKFDYIKEHGDEFLRYYHCRIQGFREHISNAYNSALDVAKLYRIGEEMGLSEVAFKRSFVEEFGLSPREWLTEQRAKRIYRELVMTNRPFKELSQEFAFCSVSHFGAFCKHALGDTPLHIRKNAQG